MLFLKELEVDGSSLVLLLFSVQLEQVLAYFQRFKSVVCESDLLPR